MGMENYICQKIKVIEQLFDKISQTPSQRLLKQHFCRTAVAKSKG